MLRLFALLVLGTAPAMAPAADAPPYPEAPATEITPGHVLARLNLVADYVEDVRWLMGRSSSVTRTLHVREAQPREVYFQARALYRKANRLTRDYLGDDRPPPASPPADLLRPADVYRLMTGTLERLLLLRASLGMDELDYEEALPVVGATPTDVYLRTLEVSRQVNELADRPLQAGDSLLAVQEATRLARRILRQCGIDAGPESTAETQPGHVPADVFHRVLQGIRIVSGTLQQHDMKMLFVAPTRATQIAESDVIDVTNLLISELAFIGTRLGLPMEEPAPPTGDLPRVVTPSMVMARVAELEPMLAQFGRCLATQSEQPAAGAS